MSEIWFDFLLGYWLDKTAVLGRLFTQYYHSTGVTLQQQTH